MKTIALQGKKFVLMVEPEESYCLPKDEDDGKRTRQVVNLSETMSIGIDGITIEPGQISEVEYTVREKTK